MRNVMGIMLTQRGKLYGYKKRTEGGCGSNVYENVRHYLQCHHLEATNTQFIIIYEASLPQKEVKIQAVLEEINQIKNNAQLPILTPMGEDHSLLREDINAQVSFIRNFRTTRDGNNLFVLEKSIEAVFIFEQRQRRFANNLEAILEKARNLRNDGHLVAADAAETLYSDLTQYARTYFSNPTEAGYAAFKEQAKHRIHEAHDELDKHRGWKRVLGNIGLFILGFGIFYLIAIAINKNIFFNKTDSAEKLDSLEAGIDENVYCM